jgi:hypothetical protein
MDYNRHFKKLVLLVYIYISIKLFYPYELLQGQAPLELRSIHSQ